MLSCKPSGVQAGQGVLGVEAAQELFYAEVYTVLTDFYLFIFPSWDMHLYDLETYCI